MTSALRITASYIHFLHASIQSHSIRLKDVWFRNQIRQVFYFGLTLQNDYETILADIPFKKIEWN